LAYHIFYILFVLFCTFVCFVLCMFCMLLFNFVNYVFLLLCMSRSGYSVLLCCSVYCLCVTVYCATSTGCQPNCRGQIYHIYHIDIGTSQLFNRDSVTTHYGLDGSGIESHWWTNFLHTSGPALRTTSLLEMGTSSLSRG
jgi:hypothetical protein